MHTLDLTREGDLLLAGANRPFPGERFSGDKVHWKRSGEHLLLTLIDGIGHGLSAHRASMAVQEAVDNLEIQTPSTMLLALDELVRPNPGVAMALGVVNLKNRDLDFSGVGNVFACIIGDNDRQLVSRDGMVGQAMRTPRDLHVQLKPGERFIMASDGIKERFYQSANRRRLKSEPQYAAQYLVDDFGKDHDDASCLIFEVDP